MPLPGPFSAQIQRALRATGLIPGGSSGFAPFNGSTGVRYTPGGRISQVRVPVANGADTDFVFMPLVMVGTGLPTIPAGFMANDGDLLEIRTEFALSAAVSSRTYQLNIGYTASGVGGFTGGTNIFSSGTTTASNDIVGRAYVLRLTANSTAYWAESQLLFSGAVQGTLRVTTAGINWANAANIALGIKDAGSNAAAITINYADVTYWPALVA